MAAECPERLNVEFLKYIWDYPRKRKPRLLEKLKSYSQTKKVTILRSQAEIESFLTNLETSNMSSSSSFGEAVLEGDKI